MNDSIFETQSFCIVISCIAGVLGTTVEDLLIGKQYKHDNE